MQPLEMMARLASLVAPARIPLTRYHGVLAPRSSWRAQLVPDPSHCHGGCDHESPSPCATRSRPEPPLVATPTPIAAPVESAADIVPIAAAAPAAPSPRPRSRTSTSYVPWNVLLRRTFGFEVLECSSCHITMLAIAVITQRAVIDKILDHVGLSLSAQPTALRLQRAL